MITRIGYTAAGTKIHMSVVRDLIPCDRNEYMTRVVGELPEGGLYQTVAALADLNIAPSRLCGHCFGVRIKRLLAAERAARKAAA